MQLITKQDKDKLFKQVKYDLGYPIRPLKELTDENMYSFLETSIEDYSSYVNQWLIEQQWISLEGLDVEESDFYTAFSTKKNDYIKSFTYAYSKQVGLGTNAPAGSGWELKRDYITTSANTQHYLIPKDREVNEVLWETPAGIDLGIVDPFALSNWQSGGFGWSYMGRPANYVQPTYSLLLAAQDRRTKERVLQSELTYRITGLEDGRKMLHLYPIPGGRNEIRTKWGKHYQGRKVWYWYYDTNGKSDEKCKEKNSDIVRLPSDAPVDLLTWNNLNQVARQQIRDLLIAKCKITVGGIRGFYSGSVGSANKELSMDYRHLLEEGEKLKEQTKEKIFENLENLSQLKLTGDRAQIAENINNSLQYQPFQFPIKAI